MESGTLSHFTVTTKLPIYYISKCLLLRRALCLCFPEEFQYGYKYFEDEHIRKPKEGIPSVVNESFCGLEDEE